MNQIYRLCWNRVLRQWVVASELASDRSTPPARKGQDRRRQVLALSVLASALAMTGMARAASGPTGGQIIAGSGSIQQSGSTTTIQQNSPTLQLNWQSFNIGADQTVNFAQPGRSAIAVNRILGNTPSDIFGHLNANGQVWLINPNGVLFGQSAQVNVGGLVASTLDPGNDSLTGNQHSFSGSGTGSVVNQGTIHAATGGYVALLGNQVSNQGVISATLGSVALAGGSAITLTFSDSKLVHVQVDRSTLNNLAENRQLLLADGGQVIMTAGARDSLLASAVNNSGKIRAQAVENHNGTITLMAGMSAGQVNVGGQLDASAPHGGDGGLIETSAAHFALAPDAQITAAAPHGRAGTWLVDPTDLTIDSAAATTISTTLNGGTSVVEQTTATGASGAGLQSPGSGDITVAAPISWTNAAANLTLDAYNAINVNAPIGGAGKVTLLARASNLTIGSGATITGGKGVTLATAGNFINNGGASAVSTGTSAPWLIYSSNPANDTTGGLAPAFVQYNAPYSTTPAASGNGFLYSLAPTINLTGLTGTVSKVYDATTTATLTGANLQTTGLVNGDKITRAIGT
ncbi:filamentous hemagglutinin N-terminal domain-containing protein, partial [Dyella japonica]